MKLSSVTSSRTKRVLQMSLLLIALSATAVVTVSSTVHSTNERNVSLNVRADVVSTTTAVQDYIAANPNSVDMFEVIPTVTSNNSIIVFGTPSDFVVCGYNAAGTPDWWKYTSTSERTFGGEGSEAGLCGEPNQKNIVSEEPHFLEGDVIPTTAPQD